MAIMPPSLNTDLDTPIYECIAGCIGLHQLQLGSALASYAHSPLHETTLGHASCTVQSSPPSHNCSVRFSNMTGATPLWVSTSQSSPRLLAVYSNNIPHACIYNLRAGTLERSLSLLGSGNSSQVATVTQLRNKPGSQL